MDTPDTATQETLAPQSLLAVANNGELMEVARLAVENVLVEFRDSRIATIRANGLVVREKDGKPSSTIRLGVEQALKIGLKAIHDHLTEVKAGDHPADPG